MKISEVEELLGMDRETIRFYIRKGLLSPQQNPNGYREYSEEDIRQIKRILIMRSLGIGVADIREILHGEKDLAPELEDSMKTLSAKQRKIADAIWICDDLMGIDSVSFEPELYFRKLAGHRKSGTGGGVEGDLKLCCRLCI